MTLPVNALDELLPCPFCGGEQMQLSGPSGWGDPDVFWQCITCTTTGPNGNDRESATIQWNTREVLDATTERLREALEKIADPRKRDHHEPDAYTQLGCVMHIASEALMVSETSEPRPSGTGAESPPRDPHAG